MISATALARLEGLLRPGATPFENRGGEGYVDLLGEGNAIGRHPGQRVFGSRFLPVVYERLWRPIVARTVFGRRLRVAEEQRITLDLLELSPADKVIDVGCGTGNYTRYLADSAPDGLVVGIDASEAMIAAAGKRGGGVGNLAYVRGDAGNLPFPDCEFDAVCCVGVLHMLDRPLDALAEMVRVLAPGGRLAVLTSYRKSSSSRVRSGVTFFGRDQVGDALAHHGCGEIHQRVLGRAQFISAQKPVRVSVGD
jgi:SAM-dependent methyltransferase